MPTGGVNLSAFQRYLFIGGLHRSGTSLLTRLLGSHDAVASIRGAPVPENEGCYLQGAIPHTAQHGCPMHFATDPHQHLVQGHPLDRLDTRLRLDHDWDRWFKGDPLWRIEKSPVNLTRTRLYQQLFPLSQFVLIMRHPEAVAAAVSKWVDAPAHQLIDHWLDAHSQMEQDHSYLHAAMVVRYEDLVASPVAVVNTVHAFMTLPPHRVSETLQDGNLDYAVTPRMTASQAQRAAAWGYGPGLEVLPTGACVSHPLRSIRMLAEREWSGGERLDR